VLKLAAALVAGVVTFIIVGMSVAAPNTTENVWRTSGTIFAALAVTWVAYGLARVLERERRTNELVVRHMSEAVVLVDGSGIIRLINPPLAELTGLNEDDLVGSEVEELPQRGGYGLLREIVGEVLSEDRQANLFRDIEVGGDKPRDLRVYTVRMGGGSRASGWVIICQDVTDLKSLARARETGVRFLSHEMRSPLNTLKIISQIFGELTGQLTDSNAERLVAILDTETDRMLRMVGQFLDLAALDQGTFKLSLEEVQLGSLLHRVSTALEVRAAEKKLSVEKDVPDTLPPVKADPDRLEDVLHNLCDNALKYTDSGGHIRICALAKNGNVEVHVSDDGRGIAPEIQDDIFSEFVRAAEDGKSGGQMGIGLGLYMARRIIEEHGGEITVESVVGQGSDFRITLPSA
ncbi:MAG: PAS domain S-box protein, partial [Armatimonadia bacterium]|nr:PAS domain S-box protein [Armatimonadia bacterium]